MLSPVELPAGATDLTSADDVKLDPSVVTALYVEHADELRRLLLGILKDPHLVGDALQAAFAKAIEAGHKTRPESRKSWLFRVAYNEAMAIRRRAAVGDRITRKMAWSQTTEAEPADASLVRLETIQEVRAGMKQLSETQQQIVRLRIYEEKTFAEIAEQLQIPLGTALSRMRAALIKLREHLGSH